MKRLGFMLLAGLLSIQVALAVFTPPTPEQIAGLVSDPRGIIKLLKDANPEQGADVLSKAIAAVDASSLKPDDKKQLIARMTAYSVLTMSGKAPAMMAILVQSLPMDTMKMVVAAATLADPVQAQAILKEIFKAVGKDSERGKAALQASAFPVVVLGPSLNNFLQQQVIGINGGAPFGINNLPPPPSNTPPGHISPSLPTRYGPR